MLDVDAIRETLPSVKRISPEISFNSTAVMNGVKYTAKLVGVSNDYFHLYNLPLVAGTFFNDFQEENGIQVCIIGANIRAKFFSKIDPIGQYIKFDGIWLKVIGVLQKTTVSLTGFEEKGVNVYNDNYASQVSEQGAGKYQAGIRSFRKRYDVQRRWRRYGQDNSKQLRCQYRRGNQL